MHQCRHHAIGIELHVGRVVLIALQRQQMLRDLPAFFLERDTHFLSANRIDVVIELQHVLRLESFYLAGYLCGQLSYAANLARSCGWPKSTGVPFGMIMVGFTL